jgi:hypothetical protein
MYFGISPFLASSILIVLGMHPEILEVNVLELGEVANFGTDYFLLKINVFREPIKTKTSNCAKPSYMQAFRIVMFDLYFLI